MDDWTVKDGRSDRSDKFEELVTYVAQCIRNAAHALISGATESVARVIVANLAHKYHMKPIEGLKPALCYFPLGPYSMLLGLDNIPSEGDKIKITEQNLITTAGGVNAPETFGSIISVQKRLEDQGWTNRTEVYPSFSCIVSIE